MLVVLVAQVQNGLPVQELITLVAAVEVAAQFSKAVVMQVVRAGLAAVAQEVLLATMVQFLTGLPVQPIPEVVVVVVAVPTVDTKSLLAAMEVKAW